MGRKLLPPDEIRTKAKFRAQRKILDALTAEAIEEGIPKEHLIESIIVKHVEKRLRKTARAASRGPRRPRRRAAHTAS